MGQDTRGGGGEQRGAVRPRTGEGEEQSGQVRRREVRQQGQRSGSQGVVGLRANKQWNRSPPAVDCSYVREGLNRGLRSLARSQSAARLTLGTVCQL